MRFVAILLSVAAVSPSADFVNAAREAGLTATFPNGGDKSKEYILETTGSGVAVFDYDNDGSQDALILSGEGGLTRLYRNRSGRFSDVTAVSGIARKGWAQGACAGDYDNDGYIDVVVTYWGQNALYHNESGKRFSDRTEKAGLIQSRIRYNTGCAFFDYDNDGDLDLFVANYLKFDYQTTPKPGANPYCFYREIAVSCGPRGLPFDHNILYRNNGDGTFADVSEASGIAAAEQHYALGVITGDFNGDGFADLYVACDQTPSILYVNRGDGTFADEALFRGVAFDENGKAMSGMGIAAADYDGDGRTDLFRSNFSDERETLYRNLGKGEFEETTLSAGLAHNTRFVGWGCGFFDFDLDGWKDILLVNGHVFPEVDRLGLDIRFRDRAILYRNRGGGRFEDISESSGAGIRERHAARGAALADFDNDGVLEVLVNNQNEPPSLFRQATNPTGHWLLIHLQGTTSNRSAIGAKVRLTAAGRTQSDEVRSGGSYLSQSDLRLHFGLGSATQVDRIEVTWPSGKEQVVEHVKTNQILALREP